MRRDKSCDSMKKCVIIVKPKVRVSPPTGIQLSRINGYIRKKNNTPKIISSNRQISRYLSGNFVQDSNDILSDVGIQGMNKIFNRNYSIFGKLIWAVAILSCFAFCVIQIEKRIRHYINVPVTLSMDLEREAKAEFPAISICPFFPFRFNKKLWKLLREYYKMYPNENANLGDDRFLNIIDLPNVTASAIWNVGAVEESYAGIICQVLSTMKNCDLNVRREHFATYLGICAKYQLSDVLQYDGPYNGMRIDFEDHNNYPGMDVHYMVIIHHPDDDYRHLMYKNGGIYLQDNSWTQIKFAVKKYTRYNTPSRSCQNRRDVHLCFTNCIEYHIRENITCRLPYIREKLGLPMCNTSRNAKNTYAQTISVYEKAEVLCQSCPKPCLEIFYNGFDTILERTPNVTRVSLYYHDNIAEIMKELPVYTFDVLLADVGGSLGLFLGVCLLSFMQLVESIFVVVKKRVMALCLKNSVKT